VALAFGTTTGPTGKARAAGYESLMVPSAAMGRDIPVAFLAGGPHAVYLLDPFNAGPDVSNWVTAGNAMNTLAGKGISVVAAAGGAYPFAISAKAPHPAQAAEFLNFFNSPEAANAVYASGEMPNNAAAVTAPAGSLNADLLSVFRSVSSANGFTDAYANATSSMDNTFIAQTQELIAGKTTPNALIAAVQADWQNEHG